MTYQSPFAPQPSQHSRGNAHTPRTRTSRSRCHQWTRQRQRRRRTAHPTAPRDARTTHLSAHEDERQLVLLDLHTKRHRSAPTTEIRKRLFAAIKHTRAGQECTKRPRSKRPRDARKTYLCGCWSAYCRSDIGLQPRSVCRCRSWSPLRCKPCRCGCSNSSLSCKRGPAESGGVGVVKCDLASAASSEACAEPKKAQIRANVADLAEDTAA